MLHYGSNWSGSRTHAVLYLAFRLARPVKASEAAGNDTLLYAPCLMTSAPGGSSSSFHIANKHQVGRVPSVLGDACRWLVSPFPKAFFFQAYSHVPVMHVPEHDGQNVQDVVHDPPLCLT